MKRRIFAIGCLFFVFVRGLYASHLGTTDTPQLLKQKAKRWLSYVESCQTELGPIPHWEQDQRLFYPIERKLNGKVVRECKDKEGLCFAGGTDVPRNLYKNFELIGCDNPSLGALFHCDTRSKLNNVVALNSKNPDVYWVGIERPNAPWGMIGWNAKNGKSCFIGFNNQKYPSASLLKQSKKQKMEYSLKAVERLAKDNCLRCHRGPDAWVVTPVVKGFFDQLGIPRHRKSYAEGNYKYSFPGIEHSDLYFKANLIRSKTRPLVCESCHLVTDSWEQVFDSLGQPIWSSKMPHLLKVGMSVEEAREAAKFAVDRVKSKPWMPYFHSEGMIQELEALRDGKESDFYLEKVEID